MERAASPPSDPNTHMNIAIPTTPKTPPEICQADRDSKFSPLCHSIFPQRSPPLVESPSLSLRPPPSASLPMTPSLPSTTSTSHALFSSTSSSAINSISVFLTSRPSLLSERCCIERTLISGCDFSEKKFEASNSNPVNAERSSLPKSISVRSSGYLKANEHQSPSRIPSRQRIATPVASGSQRVCVTAARGRSLEEQEALEFEVYNQGMAKTELCNKWQETGTCPYGEHCQFAHGINELRPVIRHPRYKTEVCRMILAGDICPYGHRCHFRHSLTEQERLLLPR